VVRREDLAYAIADAARAVPGVADLSSGAPVEVSTQFAGGKVLGVRLRDEFAEVHIVADRAPLHEVAERVAQAVGSVLAAAGQSRPVTVVIDDVTPEAMERRTRQAS
jgi:hypothetical protein